MFVYSKAEKSKIIHFNNCGYAKRIKVENRGYFHTLKEARMKGYHLCTKSDPLYIDYCRNRDVIEKICRDNNITCKYSEGRILIVTQDSEWIIVTENMHKRTIYHRNLFFWKRSDESEFPGFHVQCTRSEDYATIEKCLEFILEHDRFRMQNEIVYFDARKHSGPAQKGTKRWKKEEKMRRHIERRKETERVKMLLSMISEENSKHNMLIAR